MRGRTPKASSGEQPIAGREEPLLLLAGLLLGPLLSEEMAGGRLGSRPRHEEISRPSATGKLLANAHRSEAAFPLA